MAQNDDDDTVGDKPLIEIVHDKISQVASFRQVRFNALYAEYQANGNLDANKQEFIYRCGQDILDNPA